VVPVRLILLSFFVILAHEILKVNQNEAFEKLKLHFSPFCTEYGSFLEEKLKVLTGGKCNF